MAIQSEVTVTRVWAGLSRRVRPPTKVSSFPPVFLVLFFVLFFYIYFFVGFYFIFNSLFSKHNGTAYLQNGVIFSLGGGCHRAVGSV